MNSYVKYQKKLTISLALYCDFIGKTPIRSSFHFTQTRHCGFCQETRLDDYNLSDGCIRIDFM